MDDVVFVKTSHPQDLQSVGLDELVRIVRLKLNVYTCYIKAGVVVPSGCTSSAAR
jgi:hypothetical protein